MPALCFDIDNVIAQTDEVMRQVIDDYTGSWVKLSYEHVVEFNYYEVKDADGYGITRDEWREIHDRFSEPRYLLAIQPYPGVQRHLRKLGEKFELHLATSRLLRARRATIEWLEMHHIPAHDLHFLKHGQKHVSLGTFTAAVEDDYQQAVAFAQAGTPCYLLAHPWNKTKPATKDVHWVKDWDELVAKLLSGT
jgi:uncharacterized HAD superfamily protein